MKKLTTKYGRRYPWDEWLTKLRRGFGVHLRLGRDFNGRVDTMAQQVRNRTSLKKIGVRISVAIDPDGKGLTLTLNTKEKHPCPALPARLSNPRS